MYSSEAIRDAVLAQGSLRRYWWKMAGQSVRIRMPDTVESDGRRIPYYTSVAVVEVTNTGEYDSYGVVNTPYEVGIVFEIEGEFWKAEGTGNSYDVYFGEWDWDYGDSSEKNTVFRKVNKMTRTISEYH